MYKNTLITVLLLVVVSVAAGKYIAAIASDAPSGQVYVLEYGPSPILYEMDTVSLAQNNNHFIQGEQSGSTAHTNSLYIRKKGHNRFLYAAFDAAYDAAVNGLTVKTFRLPTGNQQVLPFADSGLVGSLGGSLDPSFDSASNWAVYVPSRNLSLVNLDTLDVSDTLRYWGNRVFGRNVVRNNNNKRVIVFYSYAAINAPYGLSVTEFDVAANKFVEVETTYKCLCETNPTSSPFYKVVLDSQSCKMNYLTNTIWCSNSEKTQIFSFQADDLSKFKRYNLTVAFDRVVWDFTKARAYSLVVTTTGFTVRKINLNNGEIIASKSTTTNLVIDATVTALDPNEPQFYVAVFNEIDDASPTRIVTINTNTLASTTTAFTA